MRKLTKAEKTKARQGRCITRYCSNAQYVRPNGKTENYCTKCRRRRQKASNPLRYHYDIFKQNAKTRGKDFSITFKEYCDFAIKHKLLDNKGKKKSSFTIDRIISSKGYSVDNIQIMTLAENSRKGYAWLDHNGTKDKQHERIESDLPF